jgi:hypothetical protein
LAFPGEIDAEARGRFGEHDVDLLRQRLELAPQGRIGDPAVDVV